MFGNDFVILIKPTTSPDIPSFTRIDFSSCEDILRNYYKIYKPRIITFLQVEINNTNDFFLINQIEYQAYDDDKNLLNLSLCNNSNINIFYSIKSNISLDISSINSFKDLNIDIFNIKDKFFTDICLPYSDSKNDIVLSDRIIDFYQNYSFCDNNCLFNEIDLDLMIINCNCSIKTNISVIEPSVKLEQLEDIEKSMAFEIIKCYNLVFSWKNKVKNIGFWIFSFILISHIILLCIYFYKGVNPIKEYLVKEMIDYGYIKKNDNIFSNKNKTKTEQKKNDLKKKENKNKSNKKLKLGYPPKKSNNINISKINQSLSINKMKQTEREFFNDISNIKNNNKNENKKSKKNKGLILSNNTKKENLFKTKKGKENILNLPTQEISSNHKNKKSNKKENSNNYINLNLISINLNNLNEDKFSSSTTNYILNSYTFDEAIKKDKRQLLQIIYIYLLAKQAVFHAFLYKSPLELFPLRLSLLLFIFSSDLALNAFFYFDDKISEKYRNSKNIFVFALTKNITIILLSTFIGFIFLTLFTKLSNSTNDIRDVFRKEEEKLKKNKKYIVTDKRKKEIQQKIKEIIKNYNIKIIILTIIETILLFLFWYYVTAFCHVYSSTQTSWLLDSILSILFRVIIDFILCLFFGKIYRIAIDSNIYCIYKVSLFFYCFC